MERLDELVEIYRKREFVISKFLNSVRYFSVKGNFSCLHTIAIAISSAAICCELGFQFDNAIRDGKDLSQEMSDSILSYA